MKVEFILDDHHHDIFGARHTEQNAAGSEILVWYSKMGTVNLAIVGPGDAELRELLTVVGDIAWEAMTAIANIAFLPFFPSWIAYINTGGAYDQFCGGGYNRDADVHVQGVSGWQYPAWKTSCPSTAEVSYAVEFGYSSLGTTGWKLYKSTIKVSVDFGYVEDTWYGTYRNVKVKSVSFEEYWNVYVYWPST